MFDFSIVTIVRNDAAGLTETHGSLFAQTFASWEWVIVDGASSDGSAELARSWASQRVQVVSERDSGIYDAMNKAVKYARGKWYLFLGADDELLDGFSEMAPFLADPNCIYYGDFVFDTMRRAGGEFDGYRFSKAGICHQNILYPSVVFDKYKYDEKYPINADYFLNLQCWADESIRFEYYPFIVAKFSSSGVSSNVIDEQFEKDRGSIIKKYLGTMVYYRYLFKEFRKKITGKK